MISLQYPSNEAWAIQKKEKRKKEKRKDGMPEKHDPKERERERNWTNQGPRKKRRDIQ